MVTVTINTREAIVSDKVRLTVGSAGIPIQFVFSEEWGELNKVACFKVGEDGEVICSTMDDGQCEIPPVCLEEEDEPLLVGAYGWNDALTVVIPTIWASAGVVRPSTSIGQVIIGDHDYEDYDEMYF